MEQWRRTLEHLQQAPQLDFAAMHKCLAAGRVELLLSDLAQQSRYIAFPHALEDMYCRSAGIYFRIAVPGTRATVFSPHGYADVRAETLSFDCREPVTMKEANAIHLAAALNLGMLGHP